MVKMEKKELYKNDFISTDTTSGYTKMIAQKQISKGTLLLTEKPLNIVPINNTFYFKTEKEELSFCKNCFKISFPKSYSICMNKYCNENYFFCSTSCRNSFDIFHKLFCTLKNPKISEELQLAILMTFNNFPTDKFEAKIASKYNNINQEIENSSFSQENITHFSKSLLKEMELKNNSKIQKLLSERIKKNFLIVKNYSFSPKLYVFDTTPYALSLYEASSYFNHSCDPNCHVIYHKSEISIFALKDIQKGTELCFSYSMDVELFDLSSRKNFLFSNFGFDCNCDRCSVQKNEQVDENEKESLFVNVLGEERFEVLNIASEKFRNGDLNGSWDVYKEFFDKWEEEVVSFGVPILNKLSEMLIVSIFTNNHKKGLKISQLALKVIKSHQKNKNPSIFLGLIKTKFLFLELYFISCQIQNKIDYLKFEDDIFNKGTILKSSLNNFYGHNWKKVFSGEEMIHCGFGVEFTILNEID